MTASDPALFTEQLAIEEEMRKEGIRRFRSLYEKASDRGDWAETRVGRGVISNLVVPFIEGIENFIEQASSKPGRRNSAVLLLKEFNDIPAAAFIFLRYLMGNLAKSSGSRMVGATPLTGLSYTVGSAIHDEFRLRYFDENHKNLWKVIWEDFNKNDLSRKRRKDLVQRTFARQKVEWRAPGWTKHTMTTLGHKLADIFASVTGAAKIYKGIAGPNKSMYMIELDDRIAGAIQDRAEIMSVMSPVYWPTIIPPRPWRNGRMFGGGYWSSGVRQYPMIKRGKSAYLQELENTDLSNVLTAINAVQDTGRRINKRILEVLLFCKDADGIAGIPPANPKPLPMRVVNYDELSEDRQREIRAERYEIRLKNKKYEAQRLGIFAALAVAKRFASYDAIYFPHDMDSRGRMYCVPQHLNPQGADYAKALLEFSEGKPIETPEARSWLYIAAANAWGFDKASLRDRAEWVLEHQELVFSVAESPLDDLRWADADEPFQFLRLCFDIRDMAETEARGETFVSHAVIPVDATCSGIQHFSAMLRDEKGGAATNLLPNEERQDIYQIVADNVRRRLEVVAAEEEEEDAASYALQALTIGVDRKVTKRPVMVVPYAGTFHSTLEYTREFYEERKNEGVVIPNLKPLAATTAKCIWKATEEETLAASRAKKFLGDIARRVSRSETPVPIQWVTPAGLPVQQFISQRERRPVKITWLDGGSSQLYLSREKDVPDVRGMSTAIAPNFVHSLDGSHLQLTICRATVAGEDFSWSMVHDSFGTHAASMDNLAAYLREAFVYQYSEYDVLGDILATNKPSFPDPEDLPDILELGTLDLSKVLESQYFFS